MADIPIVLVVCVFLGFLAIGIGEKTLTQFDKIDDKQKSIKKFDDFVELAKETCYGELGREKKIEIDLKNYTIKIEGKLVQLNSGKETIKSEYLPIPVKLKEKESSSIQAGKFLIELVESKKVNHSGDRLILKLARR